MSAEIVSIFSRQQCKSSNPRADELRRALIAATQYGDFEKAGKLAAEYQQALIGDWPAGDKPSDSE